MGVSKEDKSVQEQPQRALSKGIALTETSAQNDYYWRRPIEPATGLFAIVWTLLITPVGMILAVINLIRGVSRKQMSIVWFSAVALVLGFLSIGYVVIIGIHEVLTQGSTLAISEQRYSDEQWLSYAFPEGLIPVHDDTSGTTFRSLERNDFTYSVYRLDYPYEEVVGGLLAATDTDNPDRFVWLTRVVNDLPFTQNVRLVQLNDINDVVDHTSFQVEKLSLVDQILESGQYEFPFVRVGVTADASGFTIIQRLDYAQAVQLDPGSLDDMWYQLVVSMKDESASNSRGNQ